MLKHVERVRWQGDVPCCVSAAVVVAMEALDAQAGSLTELSMLYHYYQARASRRHLGKLDFRSGMKAAFSKGICRHLLHPDREDGGTAGPVKREDALRKPGPEAEEDASAHRIAKAGGPGRRAYARLSAIDRRPVWRNAIFNGFPVLIGFDLTEGYSEMRTGGTDRHPVGSHSLVAVNYGHAVTALGYDDAEEAFRVQDCQGPEFGDGGGWWMPYELIESDLVVESWAIGAITYD